MKPKPAIVLLVIGLVIQSTTIGWLAADHRKMKQSAAQSLALASEATTQTHNALDASKHALEAAETWELIAGGALAELEQAKAACRRAIHFVGSR